MDVLFLVPASNRDKRQQRRSMTRAAHIALAVVMGVLITDRPAVAQDAPETEATVTTSDPTVPLDQLKVELRPLTKDELDVKLQTWLVLLKAKITKVGHTELKLKTLHAEAEQVATTESDARTDPAIVKLSQQLIALRTEETALTERARIVIEELKHKGGDVDTTQLYIDSVSNLRETTDATSFIAALTAQLSAWAMRDDGGQLWMRRAILAVVILLLFWIASKFAGHVMGRGIARHPQASTLLENFARRTAGGVVFLFGLIIALGTLGVPLGPLMAALGGGGFIVGFALQETLGNFASGLLIMVYRPFDLDDYVNVAGVGGTVKRMSLVSTTLSTPDNKLLIIPNKSAWGGTITNFTGNDLRRVDLVFGISYDDDIQHAIDVLTQVASAHELVLDEPAPTVNVDKLGDSTVDLFCRPWVKTADYGTVHSDLTLAVKEHFDAEGIHLPCPQHDVHLHQLREAV